MNERTWPFPAPTEKSLEDFVRETHEHRKQDELKKAYERAKRAVDDNR